MFFGLSALRPRPVSFASSTGYLLLCRDFLDIMLPEIFMFVICLGLPPLTNGRDLTETILLPKLKVNLQVNCSALGEAGSSFRHWILPNLLVIGGNNSGNNPRNIIVSPENFSLYIWRCVYITSVKFDGKVNSVLG